MDALHEAYDVIYTQWLRMDELNVVHNPPLLNRADGMIASCARFMIQKGANRFATLPVGQLCLFCLSKRVGRTDYSINSVRLLAIEPTRCSPTITSQRMLAAGVI